MAHPLISIKTGSKRSKLKPVNSFVITIVKEKKKKTSSTDSWYYTFKIAAKQDMQYRASIHGCFQTKLPHDWHYMHKIMAMVSLWHREKEIILSGTHKSANEESSPSGMSH